MSDLKVRPPKNCSTTTWRSRPRRTPLRAKRIFSPPRRPTLMFSVSPYLRGKDGCVGGGDGRQWRQPGDPRKGSANVKIEIYDQAYNVNADQNEEYLQELAAYVDGKMREIATATKMVDS